MKPENTDTWRVEVSGRVKHKISRLPADERVRILRALGRLAQGPRQTHTRKLRGRPEWRLRVGSRRALFIPDIEERTITVLELDSRSDVYKDD